MTYEMYAMRDKKTSFMQPMLDINDKSAIRNFELALSTAKEGSAMKVYPDDFDLYHVGTYDTDSGVISPTTLPRFVCNGEIVRS